jgi:hypothetical protein
MRSFHPVLRLFGRTSLLLAALAALPLAACDRAPRDTTDTVVPAEPEEFAAEAEVAVQITETGITLSQDQVQRRNLDVTVINQAGHAIDFRIEGVGVELGNIAPGSSSSLGVRLEPGSYEIIAVPSGEDVPAGQEHRATLVVTG